MSRENPAVVQSDGSILLEVDNPAYESARDSLMRFSDLVKSRVHSHLQVVSPVAVERGFVRPVVRRCPEKPREYSRYPVPQNIKIYIEDTMGKYGILRLESDGETLLLHSRDPLVTEEIKRSERPNHVHSESDLQMSVLP